METRRFPVAFRNIGAAALGLILTTASASPSVAGLGDCAQPSSGGEDPVASDCLFILRAAVGQHPCSVPCICDTNGNGSILASDAQLCLRFAVGQASAVLACNCPPVSSTTTTSSTSTTLFPPPCDLLVNGDFEAPVTTTPENGWSFANIGGSDGWKTSGGNPGGFFRLNQSGEVGTDPMASQTVEGLTPGASYRLSGEYRSYAPLFGDPEKQNAFAVTVEPAPPGSASIVVLELSRPSPAAEDWTPFSVNFVANASTTTISFVAEREGDDSSFDIDNICLGAR